MKVKYDERMREKKDLLSQLQRAESDVIQKISADFTDSKLQFEARCDSLTKDASRAKTASTAMRKSLAEARSAHAVSLQELLTARLSLEDERARADVAERNAAAADFKVAGLSRAMSVKVLMVQRRDLKMAAIEVARKDEREVQQRAEEASALEVQSLKELSVQRLLTIRRLSGKLGGRPELCRTVDELGELPQSTSAMHKGRMMNRVGEVLGEVGTEREISTEALMEAVVRNGYLNGVWESEEMWALRMNWLEDVCDDLSLSWDADFTRRVRDKLVISYDKLDELRFMLSHHRVGKRLVPRTWVINPWTGSRINYPQPIRPRNGARGWARLVSATQARFGLNMDKTGRVAQRSYSQTVALQFARDQARGLLKAVSNDAPLISVLGADSTGVGKRSMMHVANSIAPSYRDGISVENEKPQHDCDLNHRRSLGGVE